MLCVSASVSHITKVTASSWPVQSEQQAVRARIVQTHISPCGCRRIYAGGSARVVLTRRWHKHGTLFDPWPPSLHAVGAFHTLLAPRQLITLWKISAIVCESACVCVCVCVCLTLQLHGHQSRQPTRWNTWRVSKTETKRTRCPLVGIPNPGASSPLSLSSLLSLAAILLSSHAPAASSRSAGSHSVGMLLQIAFCSQVAASNSLWECVRVCVHSLRNYLE